MKPNTNEKVIVGLSGGVDSAVACLLLLQQGYRVEALFMKNWEEDDDEEYCSAAIDLADARAVASQLGIELHTVNFSSEYWERVFTYFLHEYQAGRTPNPDVMCNREIKFRAFLDHALTLGANRIATGHYSRIRHDSDGVRLLKGLDTSKDQSYFLHQLSQQQLARTLFPIGEMEKRDVRTLASESGFTNHDKKDSTGICFIGERRFRDFLQRFLPVNPGDIITLDGAILGRHQGLMYYTLGQREGLGIGGQSGLSEQPWYIVDKLMNTNQLVVAQGHDHPSLLNASVPFSQPHWIHDEPAAGLPLAARIRYRQQEQPCTLVKTGTEIFRAEFTSPQRAATPGQSIVFYSGEQCLGGGIIEKPD